VEDAPHTSAATVVLDGLTRCYGDFIAVNHTSLSGSAGEAFGLIGANGPGKGTSVTMLTTLLPPSAGSAAVAGFDIVR